MGEEVVAAGAAARLVRSLLADGRRRTTAEIGAATGLARSTVVNALKRLADLGQVEQHAGGPQGRGRPSSLWSTPVAPGPLAVVVGGAHGTTVGVVASDGTVLSVVEDAPLPQTSDGLQAGRALALLDEALGSAAVTATELSLAVVGLPGPSSFSAGPPVDAREVASGHLRRFRTWDGQSPASLLHERLRRPVYLENDVNLAALGEATAGAGAGLEIVLHVGLAHGTGSGLVIGGRLHRGSSGLAGEIGHLHADDDGRLCQCGARGCFWHTRSVPALLESLAEAHGHPFTLAAVATAAERRDPDVERALVDFGEALGRRLADAVVFLDPDGIIVDGSMGSAGAVIADGVRTSIHRYAPPSMARTTQILVGQHGITAPLVGALALARAEQLFSPRTLAPINL